MGATFDDLDEYFSPGLTLTVRGREFVVPLPSAELGLWCQRMAAATGALSESSTDEELQSATERVAAIPKLPGDLSLAQYTLGEAYESMVEHRVEHPYIDFCGMTAYIWILAGEDAAGRYWQSGGRPESLARGNRADRRAATRTGGSGTGAADATRQPASTSGTTSPTRSGRRRRSR